MLLSTHSGYGPIVFFFNDTATTEIYTLSLHDALPISVPPPTDEASRRYDASHHTTAKKRAGAPFYKIAGDRKSTRLNSSHGYISYAVFCLKKKKKKTKKHIKQECKKKNIR